MTPEARNEIEKLLEAAHRLLCQQSLVRGGDWTYDGWTADGRPVRHTFKLDGYERSGAKVERERAEREAAASSQRSGTAEGE